MASDVGELKIKLSFDGNSAKTSLASVGKDVESQGSSLVSKLGGAAKSAGKALAAGVAAGTTAAAGAVGAFVKGSVQSFAEYEQLVGGVETLFKDSSDVVMDYASNAYKTAQLSANEYMSTVTSFSASLLQSLGGDTAKAAEQGNKAVVDMADNANKMGTNIEMIQNAYQGFAKGNFMMLDNLKLGYGGTRTEMERLLSDAEKISGVHYDISSFSDMVDAIHVVQENLGITGTSAEEASHTISGSFNMMKSSWTNFMTGFSDGSADMDKLFDELIESGAAFMENMLPAVERALTKVAEIIPRVVPLISQKLPQLIQQILPPLIQAASQIFIGIVQALPTLLTTLLQGFLAVFPQLVQGVVAVLPELVTALVEFLTNPTNIGLIIEAGIMLFMGLVQAIPQILGALFGAFGKLFSDLWNMVKGIFVAFAAEFGQAIGQMFKNVINGVLNFIEGFLNTPIDAINGLIDVINSVPGIDLGKLSRINLPRLARGGVTTGPTTALIGEAGTEAVLPLDRNTGWASILASTLADEMQQYGAERNIIINVNNPTVRNDNDITLITQGISQMMRRAA